MISCYIREQNRYTAAELGRILAADKEHLHALTNKLRSAGILKIVAATDKQKSLNELADEDIIISDNDEGDVLYVFTFVGVITVAGRILKCYPKYLPANIRPVDAMRQIIRVLEIYNKRNQIIQLFTETAAEKDFNLLALMLALLQDYHEYGLYSKTQDIIEYNGNGNILWNRTIDESFAVISQNRPFYTELHTSKRISDDFDYFRRLHAAVLTELSKDLLKTELPQLFGIETVDLSDEVIQDFGDSDYISYRLECELNVEFSTRKQFVLKMLYSYINRRGSLLEEECFTLFGTNSFNLVWEDVCAQVLDDQLQQPIGSIKLPVPLRPGYNRKQKLIDLIEKPIWSGKGYAEQAADTLIPDLVTIRNRDGIWSMMIFDAKYYLLEVGPGKLRGQPGIESVTKQYLYQLAYQRFVTDHGIHHVENYFLMPTYELETTDVGIVSLPMMDTLGLSQIRVFKLPATKMYSLYITGHRIDIRDMDKR